MTPQSLSIADLKAMIDSTRNPMTGDIIVDREMRSVHDICSRELSYRILQLIPPTEPKTEESK